METWLLFFSTSAHAANNQTGSFESILPGLSHQKNYLKGSILSPHRTKALPKMLYTVNLSNWTWFKSSNDTFPKSLALDDQMIWTGQPLHPDTVITAVKAHQSLLSLSQMERWEWVQMGTAISCQDMWPTGGEECLGPNLNHLIVLSTQR